MGRDLYLDPYRVQQAFVDPAYPGNLPDRQVVHESLDRLRVEAELELSVRFILHDSQRTCT